LRFNEFKAFLEKIPVSNKVNYSESFHLQVARKSERLKIEAESSYKSKSSLKHKKQISRKQTIEKDPTSSVNLESPDWVSHFIQLRLVV